jgi:hypothetical protein
MFCSVYFFFAGILYYFFVKLKKIRRGNIYRNDSKDEIFRAHCKCVSVIEQLLLDGDCYLTLLLACVLYKL